MSWVFHICARLFFERLQCLRFTSITDFRKCFRFALSLSIAVEVLLGRSGTTHQSVSSLMYCVSPLIINTGHHIVYCLKRFVASRKSNNFTCSFSLLRDSLYSPGQICVRMHARVLHTGANHVSALFYASGCSRQSTFTCSNNKLS